LKTPPSFAEQQQHFLHLPCAQGAVAAAVFVLELEVTNMSIQVALGDQALHTYHLIFVYTKSVPQDADSKEISTITSLVMTDSSSGYIHVTPLRRRSVEFDGARTLRF